MNNLGKYIDCKLFTHRLITLSAFKYILIVLLFFTLIQFFLFWNDESVALDLNENEKDVKTIELLTEKFNLKDWLFSKLGRHPFRECEEKRCRLVKKNSFWQIASRESDLVLVHGPNLRFLRTQNRPANQLWAYLSMETPHLSYCSSYYSISDLDHVFNFTITYKSDSTIVSDYKTFDSWPHLPLYFQYMQQFRIVFKRFQHDDPKQKILNEIRAKKRTSTFTFWMVSNCLTTSNREKFVSEMLSHLNIDIYGKCNQNFPAKFSKFSDVYISPQANELKHYKFYLSFENSYCQDYVTEKYWQFASPSNIFDLHVVPIIRNSHKESYQTNAARLPVSYINANRFGSARELAAYLHYLNENQTAYEEYFKWKLDLVDNFRRVATENGVLDNDTSNELDRTIFSRRKMDVNELTMCRLCSILHNQTFLAENAKKKWSFSHWYNPKIDCSDTEFFSLKRKFLSLIGSCH